MAPDNLFKLPTKNSWQADWWYLLFAKLLLAVFLPFFSDEAYYWMWSHNLKLSYFDHPPFISWLFWLGSPLENFQFASRIPTVILGHLTIWVWCKYLSDSLDPSGKRKLFWILSAHMLVGFGSMIANPDIPFIFFWSLSILFYQLSLKEIESKIWPLLLGIALGLGFTSKYLLGLFAPLAFIHLILSGQWKNLRWQHYILPFSFGAIFSLPVWIWNYERDWQSFRFQLEHGLGKTWKPRWTGDFLLGTLVLLFPPFVFAFFKNKIFKNFKNFHVIAFISLMIFFVYTTFGGDTELNWPLALYPSFFLLIVPLLKTKKSFISYLALFGTLGLSLMALVLFPPKAKLHGKLEEASTFRSLYVSTQQYSPLYTSTYQSASYFWFLKKSPVYKLRHASRIDEYDFMEQSQPQTDSFYYLKERYQVIPEAQLALFKFEKIADLEKDFEIFKASVKK